MIHLGLSRNLIRQPALTHIIKVFPNLFCLDVSFNDLSDLEAAVNWCMKLPKLMMLSLEGNPLILSPNYKKIMVERMPNIKVLDSATIPLDERLAAAEAAKERASRLISNGGDCTTPFVNQISIDLQFRVLRNIEGGRYLIPEENCNIETEKLDEIQEEHKSSMYWISYKDHH